MSSRSRRPAGGESNEVGFIEAPHLEKKNKKTKCDNELTNDIKI